MSAGTLTLTNNSDAVTGKGTAFTTELVAGDFVVATVGGVTYTLPVKSVEGDTEITLISKYPGPSQQGTAWTAVPRATQNQVTAALVAQSTEALRGLNYDKQNWQAVFSAAGNVTVFLPDGSSFSGPSWKSIVTMLSESLKRSQNLSDLTDRDAAWLNILPTGSTISDDASGANTSWSVINGDDAAPGAGVYVSGGTVRSEYHVAGSRVSSCAMRSLMHDDNVDGVFMVSNVKTGETTEWYFNENGSIRSNKGEVKFDGLIRSNDNNIVCGKGKAFVIPASEGTDANEMRMYNWGASGSIPTGAYVNSIYGKWYNGSYQFGGIRSASTALQRVQLNVNAGDGTGASYMFNPNGTAQATQWQSTSDRRVKSCIETIPDPLAVMRSMRGYSWYYEPYGTQGFGFMADEAEKHFPGAVKTTDDFEVEMPDGSKIRDVKSVDTYGIAAALHHEAILAMMDQIEELKAEIKKLKGE